MNFKSILISAGALFLCPFMLNAEKTWHLVTDDDQKIPTKNIEYIIHKANCDHFDIVLNHDDIVIEGVTRATVEFCEPAGIFSFATEKEQIIGPVDGIITISGLAEGSFLNVFNSQGVQLMHVRNTGASREITIDTSHYQPGVYILKTSNSSIKFIIK